MSAKVSTEMSLNIFDDAQGCCITVGCDADGLGLVRILTKTPEAIEFWGKIDSVFEPELARALGQALIRLADEQLKVMK